MKNKLFFTILEVIQKNEELFFCEKETEKCFKKIQAIVFQGIGNLRPGTVPILVFKGDRPEWTRQILTLCEYGTHGASTAVFQDKVFKGWSLEAVWFELGTVLVVAGHSYKFYLPTSDKTS